jgi:hypothetical protein
MKQVVVTTALPETDPPQPGPIMKQVILRA